MYYPSLKNKLGVILMGCVIGAHPLWATPKAIPSLDQIPDGIMAGRNEAKYGAYFTPLSPEVRGYQAQFFRLEQKAYGLALISDKDPVIQSELVYLIENEIIRLHQDIESLPKSRISEFEQRSLSYATIRLYENVRVHAERLYENMLRFIDIQIPGPNGSQVRKELKGTSEALYYANFRTENEMTAKERKKAYAEKKEAFLAEGGKLEEIFELTPARAEKLSNYSWMEYAVTEDEHINVTEGKAGHVLLAGGRPAKAAGQIVIVKNNRNQITLMIVTNASGNFKPDAWSANVVAERLGRTLDISPDQIIITKGEPISTQTAKILLKGQKGDSALDKAHIKELEKTGRYLRTRKTMSYACAKLFGE